MNLCRRAERVARDRGQSSLTVESWPAAVASTSWEAMRLQQRPLYAVRSLSVSSELASAVTRRPLDQSVQLRSTGLSVTCKVSRDSALGVFRL